MRKLVKPGLIEKTYNPAEVAEELGVTRRTVYTWLRSGILPATKIGPRLWYVKEADLRSFIGGHLVAPSPVHATVTDLDPSTAAASDLEATPAAAPQVAPLPTVESARRVSASVPVAPSPAPGVAPVSTPSINWNKGGQGKKRRR